MNERDRRVLEAARDAARIAIEHLRTGGPRWRSDRKTVDAAAKEVEEVSELLTRVSPEQQAAMPGIPWREARGMRTRLAHDYANVDLDVLEGVVLDDLPSLIAELDEALSPHANPEPSGESGG
jgi:uncharacterized protein with HEPN domain